MTAIKSKYIRANWGRPLSPQEVVNFTANPWQIFRPVTRWDRIKSAIRRFFLRGEA